MEPPSRIIVGRRNNQRLNKNEIFGDFIEAFAHCCVERCSGTTENEIREENQFGNVSYAKYNDSIFIDHVDEMIQLAKHYLSAKRLYGIEVVMVNMNEEQLIGFRILIYQTKLENRQKNLSREEVYSKLCEILENCRNLEIPLKNQIEIESSKFRPRIRLLTRLREESQRNADISRVPEDSHSMYPISDSLNFFSNLLSFYAHF